MLKLKPLTRAFVSLDIETTITPYMKRKASPYSPENWVVAAGWKHSGTKKVVGGYYGEDREGARGVLSTILAGNPMFLVTFNGKFDVSHLLRYEEDYKAWQQWVANGGLLWDSQLAEYMLQGMTPEAQMLSLDETAPLYGGDLKIDEVKAYWEQGINTHLIPRQLLMDYLVGREGTAGDVENTERIFLGQIKAAKELGMVQTIRLNMGALMASIEMERNGMYVDKELGLEIAEALRITIGELREEVNEYLPKDLPFAFNWNSTAQKSALIFGGDVKYEARTFLKDDDGKQLYSQKEAVHYVLQDGTTMDTLWWEHLNGTEWAVTGRPDGKDQVIFASGKNAGHPKTKKVKVDDHDKPKSRMEDYYYHFDGYTKPRPEWESDANPGQYSTSAEVIEELALENIPFLEALGKLTGAIKDLGTYYITEDPKAEGGFKGMLTLVQPDGIIHHGINHTSTVTGRLSHSNPNMGNLPREDTSDVKMMFVSRYPGGKIISSDFKTLEIYCQAMLTQDPQLIADLAAKLDMHVARLSTVENMPYAEVLVLAKGGVGPDGVKIHAVHEWDVKRTKIKVYSFQRAYGAGAPKIAKYLKVAVDLVESYIAADKVRYPGIEEAFTRMERKVLKNSKPTQRWETNPHTKFRVNIERSVYQTFDGKRYTFTQQVSPKFLAKKGINASYTPTELKNYPVQGTGGEVMKAAMWMAVRIFYVYENLGGNAVIINTVHDALYGDSQEGYARKAGMLIHAAMLAASDLIEYLFNVEWPVPVPADTTYGPSMHDESHYEDAEAFEQSARAVRMWMRKNFMDNFQPSFGE